MANEKKIAKYQKLLMSFLSAAEDLEKKWMEESDPKKKEKLDKKVQYKKSMVIFCAKDIGKEGGNIQNIWTDMTERQQQIIQELFPYGVESDNLAQQEKRLEIINAHKSRINKLKRIEESCPPYDPNLPIKEKLKNKRFKMEKEIGWWLVVDSEKGRALPVLQIKFRVDGVEVLAVQILLDESERFTESLIMYDLAFSQETDRVEDVRVVAHAEDVVIGGAGFLFRCHIFGQVCNGITLRSKAERVKWEACRRLRVDSRGMIDKVSLETRFFNLFHRHVARQLMHDRRDHLQMGKFLSGDIG